MAVAFKSHFNTHERVEPVGEPIELASIFKIAVSSIEVAAVLATRVLSSCGPGGARQPTHKYPPIGKLVG